jgi:hypothetical protein
LGDQSKVLLDQEAATLALLNAINEKLNVPRCAQLTDLYSETTATVLTTYPALDPFGARADGNYAGAWPLVDGIEASWPESHGPRIFAYLKDTAQLDIVLEALRQLGYPSLVVSPRFDRLAFVILRSENICVISRPLNMNRVVATCEAAILNGTHTSVVQMLRAGKPVISIPLVLEQQLTASRVATMRAGYMLMQPTPQEVADAVDAACQAGALDGAKRFALKYGSERADLHVEQIVDRFEAQLG